MFDWQAHIAAVVGERGQWLGVTDEDGWPVADVPPVVDLKAPVQRHAVASLEVTVPVTRPLLELLAGRGFDEINLDAEGRIIPDTSPARLLVVAREGSREAFVVESITLEGGADEPETMVIRAAGVLDFLDSWPCPSVPVSWRNAVFEQRSRDAAASWGRPVDVAPVEMADSADGYTVAGAAVPAIRGLIQDSLDAVNQLCGWPDPHMVVDFAASPVEGDAVLIRVADGSVWDTIAEPARLAGVTVTVDVWWPWDGGITTREGVKRFEHPVLVVQARIAEEANK